MSNVVEIINEATQPIKRSVNVAYKDNITIEIEGTAQAAALNFLCTGPFNKEKPISGIRKSDFETDTSGGMGDIWTFTTTGILTFVVEVVSVSGGHVNVRAVL